MNWRAAPLVVALGDASSDDREGRGEPCQHLLAFRVVEYVEQRRLVAGQAAEQLRAPGGQPQRDVAAVGDRRHVRRGEFERLEQRGEVVAVIVDAPRGLGPLAA